MSVKGIGFAASSPNPKAVAKRDRQSLNTPAVANAVWALDFMSNALYVGRRFRILNIMDAEMRETLAIEVDTSLPGEQVVRVLKRF